MGKDALPIIPAPERLRQKDYKFETSWGYTVRPCLKMRKNTHTKKNPKPKKSPPKTKIPIPQTSRQLLIQNKAKPLRNFRIKRPKILESWAQ